MSQIFTKFGTQNHTKPYQIKSKKMKVSLVSVTKAQGLSPEELIVYTARVSNPSNQDNHVTAPKLINYLIKHAHWSPFEMVDMTVEIETSRAIAAQILRHRSFSFQEFSQRYSDIQQIEYPSPRLQATHNRQSSSEPIDDFDVADAIDEAITIATKNYNFLLSKGVARECARMILPLATQTRLYMKGSIRSWIHYLDIRTGEDTQLEHREIANEIKTIFDELFPNISIALKNRA